MNRCVTFKTLWLVSERDMKARKLPFLTSKTLLLGGNGTGKSRITKNLFWVFGCSPERHSVASWDPDTLAALEFTYESNDYLVIRQGRRLGLFNSSGRLLFAADNMAAWESHIGPFFGYRLALQRPNSTHFRQAGMDYMTLPFYLDQDGSWGASWSTFANLGQFRNWKSSTFEAFVGLRPNAYFAAKQLRDEAKGRLSDKEKELEAQRVAFKRVQDVLPKNTPSLDIGAFRVELAELGRKAIKVQQTQVDLRGKLMAMVNLREKLQTELQLSKAALSDLAGDLEYLSGVPGNTLECPTCGVLHENSFHARIQLSQDAEAMSALVSELDRRLLNAKENELKVRSELRVMERELAGLNSLMYEKKAKLRLEDVLASHSKKTLNVAFLRVTSELGSAVRKLEEEVSGHTAKVKTYEDKHRAKEVSRYFVDQVNSLSGILNVPSDEQMSDPKPGSRAQVGGSSSPRSVLAMHLALLRANVEYGDSPCFPFVVDTPQQSGQDDANLSSMINVLGKTAGSDHQVVLAVEKLPEGVDISGYEVIRFEQKQGALNSEQFKEAVQLLAEPTRVMRAAIEHQLKKAAEAA